MICIHKHSGCYVTDIVAVMSQVYSGCDVMNCVEVMSWVQSCDVIKIGCDVT